MPNHDQLASDADIRNLLSGHRLTAAFPVLHDNLLARLQAGGVRRIGGALVMPCGSPPGVWLDDQPAVKAALAREARRARGGGDAAGAPALPPDDPRPLTPRAAAQVRQERNARITAKLARANGEIDNVSA